MLIDEIECLSKIDDTVTIELEPGDCDAPDRGDSDNLATVFIPSEMFQPVVLPGMIQADFCSGDWIKAIGMIIFQIIAALAGNSKVVKFVGAAFGSGNDVFDREWVR